MKCFKKKYGCLIAVMALLITIGTITSFAETAVSQLTKSNVKEGTVIILPQNDPVKQGHKFMGWQLTSGSAASDTLYKSGTKVTVSADKADGNDIKYVADWTEKPKPSPILASNYSWHNTGNIQAYKKQITEIIIVDSYEPTGVEMSQDISAYKDGSVMGYLVPQDDGNYTLYIAGNGSGYVKANTNSNCALGYTNGGTANWFSNLQSITGLELLDVSGVTKMSYMFGCCQNLTDIIDLSSWDTSKVTDMSGMFRSCFKLINIDSLSSSWNTGNVTNMSYMFNSCRGLIEVNLSSWDTSKVTDMNNMFSYCSNLIDIDLSSWDLSNVTDTSSMFSGCSKLQTVYVKDEIAKSKIESGYGFPSKAQVVIK